MESVINGSFPEEKRLPGDRAVKLSSSHPTEWRMVVRAKWAGKWRLDRISSMQSHQNASRSKTKTWHKPSNCMENFKTIFFFITAINFEISRLLKSFDILWHLGRLYAFDYYQKYLEVVPSIVLCWEYRVYYTRSSAIKYLDKQLRKNWRVLSFVGSLTWFS